MSLDLTDRRSLMASLPKGGISAEIGVSEGSFSDVLLDACLPRELHLIDSWTWNPSEALKDDASNVPQVNQAERYDSLVRRLQADSRVKILRLSSLEAVKKFPNEYFDWVYIDADHTQAYVDAVAWWPKVKVGGWLTGHDYTLAGGHITTKTDVDRFVAEYGLDLFVTRGDTNIYEKNYPSWVVRKTR